LTLEEVLNGSIVAVNLRTHGLIISFTRILFVLTSTALIPIEAATLTAVICQIIPHSPIQTRRTVMVQHRGLTTKALLGTFVGLCLALTCVATAVTFVLHVNGLGCAVELWGAEASRHVRQLMQATVEDTFGVGLANRDTK